MKSLRPREIADATWAVEGNHQVTLSGSWDLLADNFRRRQLYREFQALEAPENWRWDLCDLRALDSGGALLLWHIWNRQWPRALACRDEHRNWFERLAQTPSIPPDPGRLQWSERYVAGVMALAQTIAGMFLLLAQVLLDAVYCVRHPRALPWCELSAAVYRVGTSSMLLLAMVGFTIGVVVTVQIGITLRQFNAEQLIVGLSALAILRELGALISALIVAGRSGSAMAAGIGAMHLTEEIDALRAFGASPTQRLVLPRVVGMVLAMPLLVVWTDFAALVGAALMSQWYLGIGWGLFVERLPESVQLVNFWIGLGKGVLFGLVISLVACFFGLSAAPNTSSLSRYTTRSVVTSLSLILLLDASLSALLLNVGL